MKFQVGHVESVSKVITAKEVEMFGEVSNDTNPLHFSDEYAKRTRFGSRIAHGMISAALISAVIGTKLPGEGAIYLSQSLQFRAPVYLDDEITATATVIKLREDKNILTLETICTNQDGKVVTKGEAVILFEPPTPV